MSQLLLCTCSLLVFYLGVHLLVEFSLFTTVFCWSQRRKAVCLSITPSHIFSPFQIFKLLFHVNSLCSLTASAVTCTIYHFTFSHSSLASPFGDDKSYWVDLSWSYLCQSRSRITQTLIWMFFSFTSDTSFIIKSSFHILIKFPSLLSLSVCCFCSEFNILLIYMGPCIVIIF